MGVRLAREHELIRRVRGRWLDLGLSVKGAIVIAVPLLTLVVSSAVFVTLNRAVKRTNADVRHTFLVTSEVHTVLTLVIDAETGVRGYLLTGQRTYLSPYNQAISQLHPALSRLEKLGSEHSSLEAADLTGSHSAVTQDLQVLAKLKSLPFTPAASAQRTALLAQNKIATDQLRRELQKVAVLESGVLKRQELRAARSAHVASVVTWTVAGLGFVSSIIATWFLTNGLAGRVRAIEANADLLAIGAELVPVEPSRDEVGRLSDALVRASALLATREATLLAIFASSPDPIIMVAPDGRILYASDALFWVTGYDSESLEGHNLDGIIHPDDLESFHDSFSDVVSDLLRRLTMRLRLRHADRSWITIELHGQSMADRQAKKAGVVLVLRDVTQHKRLEEGLVAAKFAAEQANTAKSDFLSRMSHELRTPLNAVLGFGQLLKFESLSERQSESVDQIIRGGRHLLDLINEVLDISRIEAGRIQLSMEPVNVLTVVSEVVDLVRPLAQTASVALHVNVHSRTCFLADRQRFKQVLLNLAANAIKYNRAGGDVRFNLRALPSGGGRIEVADTGPGISPERFDEVFMPFERLGAERSGVEGTGVGLALSQKLVEAMGGKLRVESAVGIGSVFSVELPVSVEPHARVEKVTPSEPAEPDKAAVSGRILYIEDNPSNVQLIERVLQRRPGIELVIAGQARLGLELVQARRPQLVLLDLNLPDAPGEEVLRALKGNRLTASIPVIVLSADATTGQSKRLMDAGASDYLTKPLDVRRFLGLVDAALGEPAQPPGTVTAADQAKR